MVRVWEFEKEAERATHTHPGAVYAVAFDTESKAHHQARRRTHWMPVEVSFG